MAREKETLENGTDTRTEAEILANIDRITKTSRTTKRFRIYQLEGRQPTEIELHLASTGGAFLRPILGSDQQQRAFLSDKINWDNILFACNDQEIVGYICWAEEGQPYYDATLKQFAAFYGLMTALPRWLVFKALHKKRLTNSCYGYRLFVKPAYRSKGVAHVLILGLISLCKERRLANLIFETYKKNTKVVRLYLRGGAKIVKRKKYYLLGRFLPDSELLVFCLKIPLPPISLEKNHTHEPHS